MRHEANLFFDYYIHELLSFPPSSPIYSSRQRRTSWEVSEIETDSSWHQTVGHGSKKGAPLTFKRFLFDLALLEREQNDDRYSDSAHTLYYLGVVHCAMVENAEDYISPMLNPGVRLTELQTFRAKECNKYLEKRVALHGNSQSMVELTWCVFSFLSYYTFVGVIRTLTAISLRTSFRLSP